MMPLREQILSFLYHGIMGGLFGFFFSFISLFIHSFSFFFRLLYLSLFMLSFTLALFYGLFQINGGVTHLYGISFFLIILILYYFMLYPTVRPFFLHLLKLLKPWHNKIKTVKKKSKIYMKKHIVRKHHKHKKQKDSSV